MTQSGALPNGSTAPKSPSTSQKPSLEAQIAEVLPQSYHFTIAHTSTTSTSTEAIYHAPPGETPDKTFVETHFLTISINIKNRAPSPEDGSILPPSEEYTDARILVFAIEVMIYTTLDSTTLFISKADSSGFLKTLNVPKGTPSPLKPATTVFLKYLLENNCRPHVQTIVSLFARAQDQYLFARSIENPLKRVLDDRGLVKWWCKILDPIVQSPPSAPSAEDEAPATAYLTIPGLDERECRGFLPGPSPFTAPPNWKIGHPLREISRYEDAPPRCLIPHFPDDPKSRFLDELDEELIGGSQSQSASQSFNQSSQGNSQTSKKKNTGQWRSVRTLEQFWEMMAFRQECSAGRLVGFIWVVLPPCGDVDPKEELRDAQKYQEKPTFSKSKRSRLYGRQSIKLKGPIITRPLRVKKAQSHEGGKLSEKDYKRLHEMLLYLDFSTSKKAQDSTVKWDRELAGLGIDGIDVVGKCEPLPAPQGVARNGVNVLQPRKRTSEAAGLGLDGASDAEEEVEVNVLSGSFIRKKTRIEEPLKTEEPKVNVLIPRKKPKA